MDSQKFDNALQFSGRFLYSGCILAQTYPSPQAMPTVIGTVLHAMRLLWTCKPSRHGNSSARTSASNGTTCACRANVLRRNRTSLRVSFSRTAIIHAHLAQNLRTSRAITERTIMILYLLSSASHRSMQYAGVCTRSGVSAIEATSFDLRSHRLYL